MRISCTGLWLMLVAVVFAVALTFATVELPRLANDLLFEQYGEALFPRGDSGRDVEVTEAFVHRYALRPIGYTACLIVLVLIVAGIVAEKRGFAAAGGIALFLPVFGHFALSMFFLAGLGLLRTLWLPLLDISYAVTGDPGHWLFGLGDIAMLPYMVLVYLVALVGVDVRVEMPYVVMAVGIWVFLLGVMAWFRARNRRQNVADFWVYRYSRHPQYLGWIVWSYGLMLYFIQEGEGSYFKISWAIPDSLPWLIATMVIVGVALLEEIKMRREFGSDYDTYRVSTPFLVPLPRAVARLIAWPMRAVLRRDHPENGRDVLMTIALYGVILMLLSYVFLALGLSRYGRMDLWPYTVFPFA